MNVKRIVLCFTLFVLFITIQTASVNCNPNEGRNSLDVDNILSEDIEEIDDTIVLSGGLDKSCYTKKVCAQTCPCGKVAYFEIFGTKLPSYKANCDDPKDERIKQVIKNGVQGIINNVISFTRNPNFFKDSQKRYAGIFKNFISELSTFMEKIKKICADGESSYTPNQQMEYLLDAYDFDFQTDRQIQNFMKSGLKTIITQSVPILAQPCSCSLINFSNDERNYGIATCNQLCRR